MDSEEEVAPILANFRRYNDFSIEDENIVQSPERAQESNQKRPARDSGCIR